MREKVAEPAGNERRLRTTHTCHATNCQTYVKPEMFTCKRHWFRLPRRLRNKIIRNYRPGQCDDWKPSAAYCEAAKEAVIFLARIEHVKPDTRIYDMFLVRKES